MNKTRKIQNNTLAIEAAPAAIPVKPKIAAMIAITMKITAHLNIIINFSYKKTGKNRAIKIDKSDDIIQKKPGLFISV